MMMYRIFLIILFGLVLETSTFAQSAREKAKLLFQSGNFLEAKPIFEKLIRNAPKDGSLSYWYAACCYETNDTVADVEKLLKYAISRKVNNAYRYLGDFYKHEFRYNEAIENYEKFIKVCKDKEMIALYSERCETVKRLQRMMKMTERICVVDSFIVDKDSFLSVYRTGRDVGTLAMAYDFFNKTDFSGTVSVTERGTDLYFSKSVIEEDGEKIKLFHSSNINGEWSEAKQLVGIETSGNDGYPFMAVDGSTFYFASDGEGSIGGYDIFVTRYDSENGSFLKPENMGMPFNSEANDYMLVINEIANLGWFATDRRVEEGKVCVYVFVPNVTKVIYNYEVEDSLKMIALSQLSSIAMTHEDENVVRKARQKMLMLMYEQKDIVKKEDFLFVIDDLTEYTDLKQFKNEEARSLYTKWKKRVQKYETDLIALDKLRDEYNSSNVAKKQSISVSLLEMENRLYKEADILSEMEVQIRNTEKKYISK